MNDYHQSLIDSELLTSTTGSVDLFLIAYLDNIKLTLETVADLRKTRRYALTPVVAFQESEDRESTRALYHRGVNTVIKYPPSFDMLRQLVEIMDSYWFDTVSLPGHSNEPW
ncbi:hypothetical protein [Saccharospirillum impatiens]|uniref:hypothetical protein n=1 Tax=Saccharospirillum impatiens TaxID=169438 RepID=UPI0003F611E1|nr:hypothetical protein [Saccharospirillum impatiens]